MAIFKIDESKTEDFDPPIASPTQIRIADIGEYKCNFKPYKRRDCFKINLILKGKSLLLYSDRSFEINSAALVFTNPLIPYSWEAVSNDHSGYYCVFTDEFLLAGSRMNNLHETPLFKAANDPVYLLNKSQAKYVGNIFQRMYKEINSEYLYKYDLIRSQLDLVIHEAIRMKPALALNISQNAASRIANMFLDLLQKQFPIDTPQYQVGLKKASDYANKLAIHINHLNAAVQEVTGKSTTAHINERIITEAKLLLNHTDWNVAEIASSLGFDYSSYFNSFFKRHTGLTPLSLRSRFEK